jgi:hypothetical protein
MQVKVKEEVKEPVQLTGTAWIEPLKPFKLRDGSIYCNMPDGSLRRLNKKFRGKRAYRNAQIQNA